MGRKTTIATFKMNNKPFRFSDSEKDKNHLLDLLENIGLTLSNESNEYTNEIWIMTCPWKPNDVINIVWIRCYWPDGVNQEDNTVQFVINGELTGEVNIALMLRKKMEKPIRTIITEKLVKVASKYTGKAHDKAI